MILVPIPWVGLGCPILSWTNPFLDKMAPVQSLHPTKWSVSNPWLYKMVVPVTCFDPQIYWQFCQKMIKPVHSWSYKTYKNPRAIL